MAGGRRRPEGRSPPPSRFISLRAGRRRGEGAFHGLGRVASANGQYRLRSLGIPGVLESRQAKHQLEQEQPSVHLILPAASLPHKRTEVYTSCQVWYTENAHQVWTLGLSDANPLTGRIQSG